MLDFITEEMCYTLCQAFQAFGMSGALSILMSTKANEAMHRMSGSHVIFKSGRRCVPLLGDFGRSAIAYASTLRRMLTDAVSFTRWLFFPTVAVAAAHHTGRANAQGFGWRPR